MLREETIMAGKLMAPVEKIHAIRFMRFATVCGGRR